MTLSSRLLTLSTKLCPAFLLRYVFSHCIEWTLTIFCVFCHLITPCHFCTATNNDNNSMERLPTRTPTSILILECCYGIMDSPSINITLCCLVFRGPWEDCANCTGIGHWACHWRGPRVILPSGWRISRRTTRMLKWKCEDKNMWVLLCLNKSSRIGLRGKKENAERMWCTLCRCLLLMHSMTEVIKTMVGM